MLLRKFFLLMVSTTTQMKLQWHWVTMLLNKKLVYLLNKFKQFYQKLVAPAPIDPQYMTLHYERLVPLLVEAIKEQQKQIEELKAKLGN
jgi:hypothetical protein